MINNIPLLHVPLCFHFLCHSVNALVVDLDLWALILIQESFLAEYFGANMIWDCGIVSTIVSVRYWNIWCVYNEFTIRIDINRRHTRFVVTHAPIDKVTRPSRSSILHWHCW